MDALLALDQGTSSSRALVFGRDGRLLAVAQRELAQHFPQPGWVEHDARQIWADQLACAREAVARAGVKIAAIGITNQRETTVLWDRATGEPLHRALVWQDRRTAPLCEQLKAQGLEPRIRALTGLVLDPYFSATKLRWLLDHVPGAGQRAARGELAFGTVDSWLLWQLTGGQVHATDPSNASRTLLYDIHRGDWCDELLATFDIPRSLLPEVRPSAGRFGQAAEWGVPICGIAGDQQAALFGQAALAPGQAKNTYGTGCFLLMNTGDKAVKSKHGMLTTIACGPRGEVAYALEGAVFNGGSTVQWLRDELKIINDAHDTEYFAGKVKDSNGVYLVPAFTGLGAPYWDPYARGALFGLTRGVRVDHIIRAALESIAYQTRDVLDAMQQDSGERLKALRVDGGAVANNFLMQFQADILGTQVERPQMRETTALGAAYLAGLACGFWGSLDELRGKAVIEREFEPQLDEKEKEKLYAGWQKAVSRTRDWEPHEGAE